jgi:DNA processing protein
MDPFLPFDRASAGRPSAEAEQADVRALIALSLVPGVGPQRLRALLAGFDRPSAILQAPRSVLTAVAGIGPRTADAIRTFDAREAVDAQMRRARSLGADLVAVGDARFPERLRQIYDPPAFLWVRGHLPAAPAVAVVGTRRCSDHGRAQARRLAAALARRGYVIVSGLAYGIDAAAHRGALEAGGDTLAVLGSGVGCIYPKEHAGLARRIVGRGALLSEYAVDASPEPAHFPERNRIVSGLSLGTVVVESHAEGGALITARMAVEQNREVFALPGNAGKASSLGANRLIQRGHAKLVLDADDVASEFPPALRPAGTDAGADRPPGAEADRAPNAAPKAPQAAEALGEPERTLYAALGDAPVHIDALCERTGVGPSAALAALLRLEFEGLVRQSAGRQFRRAGRR